MAVKELISDINPQRIKWCCDEVGMTLEELAEAISISPNNLKQVKLTFRQLTKIGDYFGYGAMFFLDPEMPKAEKIHSVAFRSLANQEIDFDHELKKLVKQIEKHRDIYLDLSEDSDEQYSFEQPALSGSIKNKAAAVRQWLNIDNQTSQDFNSYRQLIEDKGILVFQSMNYNGSWKITNDELVGLSVMHKTAPTILVKKASLQRQTFTMFHELGHLLLHKDSFLDDEDNLKSDQHSKREQDANQFAGFCLLPDELIEAGLEQDAEPENYYNKFKPLSEHLGVSVEVIVVGLLKRGRITSSNYQRYKKIREDQWNNTEQKENPNQTKNIPRTYRHREPRHIFGDKYVHAVLNALHEGEITSTKASSHLDRLKTNDIEELTKFYVRSA